MSPGARRVASTLALLLAGASCAKSVGSPQPDEPSSSVLVTSEAVASSRVEGDPPVDAARWRPIVGLPRHCRARQASRPAEAVVDWRPRPCASHRDGCLHFAADWGPVGAPFRFAPAPLEPMYADARGVLVSYLRREGDRTLSIVHRLDGPAEAAWSSASDGCLVVGAASVHGVAARAILAGSSAPHFVGAAAHGDPVALTPASLSAALPLSLSLLRGRDVLALDAMNVGGDVRATAYSLVTRRFVDTTDAPIERALPVDDGFVGRDPERVVHVDLDGTRRALAEGVAFGLDRARDDALVVLAPDARTWLVAPRVDRGWAPARRVAVSSDVVASFVANAGHASFVASPHAVHVVDLVQGREVVVEGEPDLAFVEPLFVDAKHVWVAVSDVLPGQPGFPALGGIVRVRHER